MNALIFFLSISILVQDIPFKPNEEFEIKLDFKFKQRSLDDSKSVYLNETVRDRDRRTGTGPLPYLILNVKMLKLSEDEVKVRITNNLNSRIVNRKISEGLVVPIEVGFTDDAKDRVAANEYMLTFVSPGKRETSKVVILIEEDGTFIVNGEKRGKF
jgi:hypothetical protein